MPPCLHAEAFALMWYGTGADRIRAWNSRDGVTPFYVDARKHEDWWLDECNPWHEPALGDWVFVDLTPEKALAYARRKVEKWWDHPISGSRMSDRFESKEEAIAALGTIENEGEPDFVQLEDPWQIVAICANARAKAEALGLGRLLRSRDTRRLLEELGERSRTARAVEDLKFEDARRAEIAKLETAIDAMRRQGR